MSANLALQTLGLEHFQCAQCGMTFAMPEAFTRKRREDHKGFYCPAGHPLAFHGETEAERLKREKKTLETRVQWAEQNLSRAHQKADREAARSRGYKGYATKLKNAIGRGECPLCGEGVAGLAEHMESAHGAPEAVDQVGGGES